MYFLAMCTVVYAYVTLKVKRGDKYYLKVRHRGEFNGKQEYKVRVKSFDEIELLKKYVSDLEYLAEKYCIMEDRWHQADERKINDLVLNYIRSDRYDGDRWYWIGGRVNETFKEYVREEAAYLEEYFFKGAGLMVKDGSGLDIDFPHLCATLDGMTSKGPANYLVPLSWNGWAGDLATGIRDITSLMKDSGRSAKKCSKSVIGNENYSCGYTDLRGDADAIEIFRYICDGNELFSDALDSYYDGAHKDRFKYLIEKLGGSKDRMKKIIRVTMSDPILDKMLMKGPSNEVKEAAIDRFVDYIFIMS